MTTLDPTLNRLIKKAYLHGFGNLHQFPAEKIRQYLSHPKLNVSPAHYHDITTSEGIILRCYTPPSLLHVNNLPAVVYISANAFFIDRLDANNDYCSLLAHKLGMRIINVAHRLAPEHPFPLFIDDCLHSLQWIAQHAALLHIHPQHITLWGESSGANIAATCTHLLRDQGLSIVKHQTLFYPMVDLVEPFPSKQQYAYGYMLDATFIEWICQQVLPCATYRASPLASPLRQSHFHDLPSATMIIAEHDPLHDEGLAYAQKLIMAGVSVHCQEYPGTIHGFMRFYPKIPASIDALEMACKKLVEKLNISTNS